ncbi:MULTISPECIES: peptidoglycan -binding protein [Cohaesibacter]|uniref:peptidoglycan -binding protein n=1 Tax=Cohaesibacter TaxID=655352 RepID=UPI000DE8A8C0|nr:MULTISPECIES: peptidoglycan -binding protein [Cohaesibacter]TLP43009.1 peptidoglycan -binding protein [Cohaesibacter sp. CAU 1516]
MGLSRNRRTETRADYWPGFVDAMATLLLVLIFLLTVFMVAQFFLSQEISGKDTVLNRLNSQIAELTELLALERAGTRDLESSLLSMQASLTSAEASRDRLLLQLENQAGDKDTAGGQIATLTKELEGEKVISQRALAQVELLNQQISALRRQIGALEDALEASEKRDRESQTKIASLGKRLNVALAQRVQELNRYRSDFFGRLREILSQRSDIRVVGDRFVFQSEVLFPSGGERMKTEGEQELDRLAEAILELSADIPPEIDWVLRIDGHTDNRPINSARFPSNWELSAARAISVVKYLITKGVPPNRLVAAGFGEFQPLEEGDDDEALRKNRRIELKLTQR